MSIIPTPDEARDLRALFTGQPIVELALAWLRAADIDRVADVVLELPQWEWYSQMSEREVAATYAVFVPPPADSCSRCGAAVRYVTDGPDPGWWAHADLEAVLSSDAPVRPHPATPAFKDAE